MTATPVADPAEQQALAAACRMIDFSPAGARCLHKHATTIFLIPRHQAVARIARGQDRRAQAARAVAMTRWLLKYDFPATEPLDVPQPIEVDGVVVTFWRYYDQGEDARPRSPALGQLLRDLHDLPPAPIDLPPYLPLRALMDNLKASSYLQSEAKAWLMGRCEELLDAFEGLEFVLPGGHLHGDAYPGNLLQAGGDFILGDWDEASVGPRELDLINIFQGARFGRTPDELRLFGKAYGCDLRGWPGFSTLREIRDLHTLGAFIRRADHGDEDAAGQLDFRVETLRRGSTEAWTPTS